MKDLLLDLLHRDPFVPFHIVMTSGHEYEVNDPDLVALGQSQLNLYAPKSDRFVVLRLAQISALNVGQPA